MRDTMRTALAAWALGLGVTFAGSASSLAAEPAPATADAVEPVSETAAQLADWVIASGDNRGLPFVIVDKVTAEVLVYGPDGALKGFTPALLGSARGDDSVPGIGDKKLSAIRPDERTTPAGRFLAAYGPAPGGRKVLWVDYASAVSLHPVVNANPKEQRLKRLKSPLAEDNRITYGCINVSSAFYQAVVRKTFKGTNGMVYILPESKPLQAVFPALRSYAQASAEETDVSDAASAGFDAALVR